MAFKLPSQTVRQTYIGPNGIIVSKAEPERDFTRGPKCRWQNAAARRNKKQQQLVWGYSDESSEDEGGEDAKTAIASSVVARLREQVQNSEQGLSSTRSGNTCSLIEKLAASKIAASRLAGPLLVDALDEQMQCEVLAGIPTEDMASAARTCKLWNELLSSVMGESIWERVVTSAPAHVAAAARGASGGCASSSLSSSSSPASQATATPYWQAVGKQLVSLNAALQRRWRAGTCMVESRPSAHTEYVMAMATHAGHLITGGADGVLALTDLACARRVATAKRTSGHESSSAYRGLTTTAGAELLGGSGAGDIDGAAGSAGPRDLGRLGAFDDDMTAIILRRGVGGRVASSALAEQRPRALRGGHRGQIFCVHPHGEHLASCASDGEVLIWSLRDGTVRQRHRTFGSVYSLSLSERNIACGGEAVPVRVYNWRDGEMVWEATEGGSGEQQAPHGVTTCIHRQDNLLCAGNSDTHSQLRIWDLGSVGSLRDCFSLPPYVKGVRCICAPTEQTLICGTTNGWVIHVDLRTGRYQKRGAHADCVNGVCMVPSSQVLASGGDDNMLRLADLRMGAYEAVGSHKLQSVVFSLCADEDTLYAGVEGGELKAFDYSADANPLRPHGCAAAGGFTADQKAALAAAMANERNRAPPGAFH